jgi:N-acetylmuramoyl-L-alanine amidase
MRTPLFSSMPVMRHIVRWLLPFLLPVSLFAQVNILKIEFEGNPSQNTVIGVFRRQGTLYASLTDLAQVLQLKTYENITARKLEIRLPTFRIKVTAGNPFIVITDGQQDQHVYQLADDVVSAAGAFFVPLVSFTPYLEYMLGTPAAYNPGANALRVGTASPSNELDIPALQLMPKSNGMLIRISARKHLPDLESWLRQDGWLYVTIAEARADTATINAMKPAGLIRQIVAIQSPTSVQLTFRLSGKIATSELIRDNNSNDILLSVRAVGEETKPSVKKLPEERPPEKKPPGIRSGLDNQRRRWELDVIVLDPGHGGHDPGTTGVTGIKEKDVTLGVALKLGRLIKKTWKTVRVVYTRKDDRFVELDRRGQIANEAGGKLFISIHANSMPRKPNSSRGFEVYLLRPGRTEEAIAIAERENSVIHLEEGYEERYKELTDENFILVTMAQSAHVKASEVFAQLAQQEMERTTGIPSRGVKQAGFYVLVGAAMPNVLIETAYLSNREDERFLKSERGQEKIAESLLGAIKLYKKEYEKLLKEGQKTDHE